ncbi:MAG TPA: glutamine synthetase family protein [Acetobacteraceae bacterium]|nr:glutamine synthetase family protein [Acetobacteraceae bacterium]
MTGLETMDEGGSVVQHSEMDLTPEPLAFIGTSDLAGLVRGKSIPASELERRMGRGVGLTHSNIMMSVFGPIYDSPFGTQGDLMLVPDPATRTAIPAADGPDIVLMLGDLLETDGAPWECCPRHFLRRGLAALHREFGLTLLAAFEQELVYTGVEDRAGSPYSLDALRRHGGFGGTLLAAMRGAGITPDSFLSEYAPRQYEVTVGPAQGVTAADQAVLVRELARAVAACRGHRAILAPILAPDGVGNGTHIHWSLLDEFGRPTAHDEDGLHGLSEEAEHMVAGILHHLPALCAVTAASAASYYRLRPNRWAPIEADLGVQDRGSAVRICPVFATAEEQAAAQFNVEFRVADAAASPYLALGALVWAGLDGLREQRRLADVARAPLPGSLEAALELFAASETVAEWFGDLFRDVYLRFKRAELKALAGLDEAAVCARYAAVY